VLFLHKNLAQTLQRKDQLNSQINQYAKTPACEPNINISAISAARMANTPLIVTGILYQAHLSCEG